MPKPTLATASSKPDLSNLRQVYNFLTTGVEKFTGGKGKNFSHNAALGLMGNWTHETGDFYLKNTARVQEAGGKGPGVGIQQYTEPSRKAAYQAWLNGLGGRNPSALEQAQYAINEYYGSNKDLIGWTQAIEKMPKNGTPEQYAQYFSDKLLRPGVPHTDRRMRDARELNRLIPAPKPSPIFTKPLTEPSNIFKWGGKGFRPNASTTPVISEKPDFLKIQPNDLSGKTRSIDNLVKLPGLNDVAQQAIGNYGKAASRMNTSTINARAWGPSAPDLGRATGITASPSYRAVTNSGYTMPSASSSVGSAWKMGYGLL